MKNEDKILITIELENWSGEMEAWLEHFKRAGIAFLTDSEAASTFAFNERGISVLKDLGFLEGVSDDFLRMLASENIDIPEKLELLDEAGVHIYYGEHGVIVYSEDLINSYEHTVTMARDFVDGDNYYVVTAEKILEDESREYISSLGGTHFNDSFSDIEDFINECVDSMTNLEYDENTQIYVTSDYLKIEQGKIGRYEKWWKNI